MPSKHKLEQHQLAYIWPIYCLLIQARPYHLLGRVTHLRIVKGDLR
jgi:hypothetical protein